MANWLTHNATSITLWCAAICTFGIYSVLYSENKFYRLMEHIFVGIAAGYGVYITWAQVLQPMWWDRMVKEGCWSWIFALVVGSMFYFVYSKRHFWISRVIFGLFMGLSAGGIFREFYEIYFPQIGASMKPIYGNGMGIWDIVNVIVFYIILFTCMSYFFFSIEHKNPVIKRSAAIGRWCLMIGFGAIFGATVMGRMTLFIARFNFLLNDWGPEVHRAWNGSISRWVLVAVTLAIISYITISYRKNQRKIKEERE